jgi:hypothetical protein
MARGELYHFSSSSEESSSGTVGVPVRGSGKALPIGRRCLLALYKSDAKGNKDQHHFYIHHLKLRFFQANVSSISVNKYEGRVIDPHTQTLVKMRMSPCSVSTAVVRIDGDGPIAHF